MQSRFQYPIYESIPSPDETAPTPSHHPVVIVGAGPVGLAAALDLAYRGQPSVVIDSKDSVSVGSRAICWSKRSLEIMDRLGLGQQLLDKGVIWNLGKVFFGDRQVYEFDLRPEGGSRMPAFVNLQQYYFEAFAIEKAAACDLIDLRWQNEAVDIRDHGDHMEIQVRTLRGRYSMTADYILAADGARSPIRKMMGLEFDGQVFQDRFLIADVVMEADYPAERWFWFDPPFNPGQSALLHKQADNVWRIDLQLGWDADPEAERQPERVIPRLQAMLGTDKPFELEWVSVYTFQCRRLRKFRHNRLFFIGDSAHQVSPFGARGGNGGLQDVDNLIWKLDLVMRGKAPEHLLDSYDIERLPATDENILNSTRSTDFISPKGPVSRSFRDAVLDLSRDHAFARAIVNSGRLSVPAILANSPLNTEDSDCSYPETAALGNVCPDAPLIDPNNIPAWLLTLMGKQFTCLHFPAHASQEYAKTATSLDMAYIPIGRGGATYVDHENLLAQRLGARPGSCFLIRPDQHICARFPSFEGQALQGALVRATGHACTPMEIA